MNQLTISIPPALQRWVEARLAEGAYADAGEYLRDLLRRDAAEAAVDRRWLKAMIEEGLASGVAEGEAEDVLDEVIGEDPDLRA